MFTVVICDKNIRDDCKSKYGIYLKPLLDNNDFAFCEWHTEGNSLEEAVPELMKTIDRRREWNAVIVLNRDIIGFDAIRKRNPFDYAGAVKVPERFDSAEQIDRFRAIKSETFKKALNNPLTKLSIWLSGIPLRNRPELPEVYAKLPDILDPGYFDAIEDLGLDAVEVEIDRARLEKYELTAERFDRDGAIFNLPKHIFAISERTSESDLNRDTDLWKDHFELDYSRFYEDNLYPDKLRYLIFNIPYIKRERNELSYFNYLTALLILATQEPPYDAIRANRVYRLEADVDSMRITGVCSRYIQKLRATHDMLANRIAKMKAKEPGRISDYESERIFESESKIPVKINSNFDTSQLMAKYNDLGLAGDCPSDEMSYWDGQYHSICKLLIRYLREPKRAVKSAINGSFRKESIIDDDRAFSLNESQRENVLFKLQEEERLMVESTVNGAFETKEYQDKMDESDRELRRSISHRMTKTKTLVIGLIAAGAYLIGFLPLIIHGGSAGHLALSLILTLCAVGALAGAGIIGLFVFKHRLVNRFKSFNYVMSGILSGIEANLERCSVYLSHTCNVMREFSVINRIVRSDDADTKACKIMKNHLIDIENKLDDVTRLFSEYLSQFKEAPQEKPYDYEFTELRNYDYPMPYTVALNSIEYIQRGNKIDIPVDYLQSVTVEREELYD